MMQEGAKMKISVTYEIDQTQQERLNNILTAYNAKGAKIESIEKLFDMLMQFGSIHTINSKLDYAEANAGLKE